MSQNKNFAGIETDFSVDRQDKFVNLRINDGQSLLDYDCIIINANQLIHKYCNGSQDYKFRKLLTKEYSEKIRTDFNRVKSHLIDLLSQGKNVYVLLGDNPGCYVQEWRRNQWEYTYFSSYSFLPLDYFNAYELNGTKVKLVNQQFKSFFDPFIVDIKYKNELHYRGVSAILKVGETDRIVSGIVPYEKGQIIFLPYLDFISEYDHESCERQRKFVKALMELENLLSTPQDENTYPEWIDNYNILTETDDIKQLNNLENEKNELLKQIEKQKECLNLLKKYKGLFTSSGKQLENIVKEIFEKIGFQVFPSEPNRTDVIAKYNDTDVVMEIKGLTKSAAEKNAAQLEKWVSMFIEKEERTPKPLLIVNAFCDTPLEQRTEDVFPNQMLSYSTSRNHCLISTTQLLCLFIEGSQDPECKEDRIKELLTTVGVYNRYPDYTQFIKKVK